MRDSPLFVRIKSGRPASRVRRKGLVRMSRQRTLCTIKGAAEPKRWLVRGSHVASIIALTSARPIVLAPLVPRVDTTKFIREAMLRERSGRPLFVVR